MAAVVSERNLRHKPLKVYDDEDVEDEIDGKRTFDVMEKIKSNKYDADCVVELTSDQFSFEYIQRHGFYSPIRFKEKEHLGMLLPDPDKFTITDIRGYVGGRRMLDVMECVTQRAMEMSMRDFAQYFEGTERKRIYNVISLEFSQTRLGPLVKRPAVVDKIDWIDLAWPPHLKYEQSEQTNKMAQMKYPKVQKYCLMSVKGCYTDYHVDFGGTSVWYHILKGEKLFWLIPPTNKNLEMYEQWTMSGKQGDLFFGDLVEKCQRLHLQTGDSLMIPSGWIHAVYTPSDSIVFGGNFLHSFNIPMQLRIAQLEERLHVPPRFRFPYFQEVLWYTVERYVCNLTGKSYLTEEYQHKSMLVKRQQEQNDPEGIKEENTLEFEEKKDHVHLTQYEYKGIQQLVESLENLPKSKKFIPVGIEDASALLAAAKQMLFEHSADDSELAITGEAIPCWPKPVRKSIKRSRSDDGVKPVRRSSSNYRVRRVRCKECEACVRGDCGDCVYCKDMKKYGGPGTMKQSCLLRRCTNPILPSTVRGEGGTTQETPTISQESIENELEEEAESPPPVKKGKISSRYRSSENGTPRTPRLEKVKMSKEQSPLIPRVTIPRLEKKDVLRFVVRPVVGDEGEEETISLMKNDGTQDVDDPTVDQRVWMQIFKRLPQEDLCRCMRVCKSFLKWCSNSVFWKNIDLSESPVTPDALKTIVRRTPTRIDLTRSYVSAEQLSWLIKRCPSLRDLVLVGNSWSLTGSLYSAACPQLHSLNLSWVTGFTDSHLKQLVSPPTDGRPGQQVSTTRLRFLRHLHMTGTDITNAGVSLLPSKLPYLRSIDISYCSVADKAVRCLVSAVIDQICPKLTTIIARSCPDITQKSLKHITELKNINKIDFRDCCQITEQDCDDILHKLKNPNVRLLDTGLFVVEE